MIHELKILPRYFKAVYNGDKTFEVRKNDRKFRKGDYVLLREWDGENYTGREFAVRITYILKAKKYIKEGYVIFSFEPDFYARLLIEARKNQRQVYERVIEAVSKGAAK